MSYFLELIMVWNKYIFRVLYLFNMLGIDIKIGLRILWNWLYYVDLDENSLFCVMIG